jgi:hypothetical protein
MVEPGQSRSGSSDAPPAHTAPAASCAGGRCPEGAGCHGGERQVSGAGDENVAPSHHDAHTIGRTQARHRHVTDEDGVAAKIA